MRITLLGTLALLPIILTFGCTREGTPEDTGTPSSTPPGSTAPESLESYGTSETPVRGDYHIQQLNAEPPHLNPVTSTDFYSTVINAYVFDTLLYRDPETIEMTPRVAASWEISDDHLVYTFHLRKDVTFSDGKPLTAKDVQFSFDRLKDPAVDAPHLRNYYKDVTSCEVIDDYTVRFTCTQPYYRHIVALGAFDIMPAHVYSQGEFNNHANNRSPIGSGMYKFESWDTGLQIVLTRNENYWWKEAPWPWFDKKIFKPITDPTAAFTALKRGDVDSMDDIRAEDWVRSANDRQFEERLNRFEYFRPQYSYIGWNQRRPQFADKSVRRALTMMLDRETIIREIFYGLAQPVSGNFMPGTPEDDASITPLPFDPAAAQQLLANAGWKDSNNNGIIDKDGVEFRFEILLPNNKIDSEKILTVFKEELSRVGIELNLRAMEWASLLERVDARDFDAVIMAWSMPPDPDPYQVWHSSQMDAGSNYIGFDHPEADQIIEQARISFDRDERIRLYHRFKAIIHEEQPYTFLLMRKSLLAVDKRIHGIQMFTFGPEDPRWFVPTELQRYGK